MKIVTPSANRGSPPAAAGAAVFTRFRRMSLRSPALAVAVGVMAAMLSGCSQGSGRPKATSTAPVHAEATLTGTSRPFPTDFFGVNGANFIRGTDPTDPRFIASLRALAPESIRLFGGTTANYWDWRSGSLLTNVSLPRDLATLPPAGMTLDRWNRLLDEGTAAPIFDLNIVTSTLAEQLAMLHAAQSMGMRVERVELGNELYQNAPAVVARFPSPDSYAQVAAQWSSAIKADFPGVQISVVGSLAKQGQPKPRKTQWNSAIRTRSADYDAVTLHLYFASGADATQAIDDNVAAQVVSTTRTRLAEFKDQDLAGVPAGKTCWVSEFNILDRQSLVPGSWLHGLVVAQTSIALAAEPRVGMAVMHALVGNVAFAAIFGSGASTSTTTSQRGGRGFAAGQRTGRPYALTGAGEAMSLVFAASRGASSAQALAFGSDSNLVGIRFTAGSTSRLLIANLGAGPATIQLGALVGSSYHVRELSAPPGQFVSGPDAVHHQDRQGTGQLSAEPWSLTVVD